MRDQDFTLARLHLHSCSLLSSINTHSFPNTNNKCLQPTGPTAARPEPSERSSCESPTTPTPANPEPKPLQPTSKGLRRDSSSSSGVRDEGAKEGEGEIEGDSQHDESEGGGEQERHSAEGKQQQEKQEASSSAGSVHSNR